MTWSAGRVPALLRPARVPRPALGWALVALGLAVGGAASGAARLVIVVCVLAVAATRPVPRGERWVPLWAMRRPVVWLCVALAVVVGGLRVGQIDRAASPVSARTLTDAVVTLTEPLPAARPGEGSRGARAVAWLGPQRVELTAPRFGEPLPGLPRGAVARVSGALVPLGDAARDAALARAGVAGRVRVARAEWAGEHRGGVLGAIDRFAGRAEARLVTAVGERRGTLVAGMALGASDGIAEADADALRASGLWHLVAASGGNIALVVALVMALGWIVGAGDRTRIVAAAVAVCLYVPLAGFGPSIQRAGVMGLAALLALALGREARGLTALAVAAAATLALDPRAWLDVGWQLSFAAAGALVVGAPWAARVLGGFGLPRWLAVGLACTLLATVATAPVMLVTFGELSLVGVLANAVVLPLVGIVVWCGALASVLTPISPGAAALVAQPAGLGAGLMLEVAAWASARPLAVIGPVGVAAVVIGVALVVVVKPPRLVVGALAIGATALVAAWAPRAPGEPRLLVLDIGQGNATLLQDGADGVLVDAGPADGGLVGQLRRTGVRRLRAVILSHPAADHDGGAASAIAAFPTDLVLDGGDPGGGPTHAAAIRAARQRGTRVVPARAGQRIAFGRVALRLRWPTDAAARRPGDPNDRAAVVEAQIGRLRALLPADAEGAVLRDLPNLLPTGVLLVSHHGSSDPELASTLRRVRPQLAVISVGAHNTYGHPTAQALGALRSARTPTLRTDRSGTLDLRADATGRVLIRRAR